MSAGSSIYMGRQMFNRQDAIRFFNYDPETGIVTWRSPPPNSRCLPGEVVGFKCNGYLKVALYDMNIYIHRLAWLIAYGNYPKEAIDHINGDRSDNRLSNLRLATKAQNSWNSKMRKNNSSGVKGVSYNSAMNKWVGKIRVDGKRIYLGSFESLDDAKKAMEIARLKYHGEFSRG